MLQSVRQIAALRAFGLLCSPVADRIRVSRNAYPDQPIKIIVTFPPGGSADIVIRALQPAVCGDDLHQTIVIENRAGAGGNIGIGAVAQAAPDGYTLGVAAAGVLTVNPHLNRAAMSFDPLKDLAPVTLLAEIPVRAGGVAAVEHLFGHGRHRRCQGPPGELSIGHGGNGTAMHLTSALFNQKAGVRRSAGRLSRHRAGRRRRARRSHPARRAGYPGVPAIDPRRQVEGARRIRRQARGVPARRCRRLAELGLSDFESVGWFGLVAPAGTPPEIVNTAERRLREGLERSRRDRENPRARRRTRADLRPRTSQNSSGAKARNGAS